MTALIAAGLVVLAGLLVLTRARIAAERRKTHAAVEAVRAKLGIPADRCRLIDVPLTKSIIAALQPRRRLPRFEHVHRVPRQHNPLRRQP